MCIFFSLHHITNKTELGHRNEMFIFSSFCLSLWLVKKVNLLYDILNNLEDICLAISKNENISYFNYNKENKEFDMVFYWNNLMNDTEKYVYDIISDLKETDRFELEDIREIAMDLIYDESTKNLTIEKIRNSKKMELDI